MPDPRLQFRPGQQIVALETSYPNYITKDRVYTIITVEGGWVYCVFDRGVTCFVYSYRFKPAVYDSLFESDLYAYLDEELR